MDKKRAFIVAGIGTLLFLGIFIVASQEKKSLRQTVIIARVIDGDTLEFQDGRIARLLNINAPEKKSAHASFAKLFLQSLQNNSLEIEVTGTDKYKRSLVRLYTPNYVNLELVSEGLASKFLVQESELKTFAKAEEAAIKSERGMWSHSKFFDCFNAIIDEKEEKVRITNKCEVSLIGWSVKDESRKSYTFRQETAGQFMLYSSSGASNASNIFWDAGEVWNNDRDSLYLFDNEGRIALYVSYGY